MFNRLTRGVRAGKAFSAIVRIAGCFLGLATCWAQSSDSTSPPPDPAPAWVSPATELNAGLPSWLQFNGQYRNRIERSDHIRFASPGDTYDLGQFRFEIVIRPSGWFTAVAETQDASVYGNQRIAAAPPYQNTWDLRQAFVQLGDLNNNHVDVSAGREVLAFGEERLIGPSDWLNQGRTFDVARLDLAYGRLEASVFSSSVVVARDGVLDHHLAGNNLHGVYLNLKGMPLHSSLEPYGLWNVQPSNVHLANGGRGRMSEAVLGALWRGKLPAAFEFSVEMVGEAGSLGPYTIRSWGGHLQLARKWTRAALQPRPFIEANYATGTKDFSRGTYSTFDQVYPSSHNKLGFADQFGWRNIEQVRGGVQETLGRKWKLNQTYEDFWLASARDALYASSGALLLSSRTGTTGRHIGSEFDFWADWNWKTAVTLGFGYAHVFTGEFLNRLTPGKDYNYPFVYATYHFTDKPGK